MKDLILFIFLLIILFFLWAILGGPTRYKQGQNIIIGPPPAPIIN